MSSPVTIDTRPPQYQLICPHGDARVFNLAATYLLNGVATPYPLTGDSLTVLVKSNPTDPDSAALITATIANGQLAIVDGPNGKFTWTILGDATKGPAGFVTFPPNTLLWWAAKVLSGITETVASGSIRFDPTATSNVT